MASWQDTDQGRVISRAKLVLLLGVVLGVISFGLGDALGVLAPAPREALGVIAIALILAGVIGLVRTRRR